MSAPVTTMGKKFCFKCGVEVSGGPRVKDETGRYFCVPCGQAEETQRLHVKGGICEGCGESYSKSQLMIIGGQQLCPRCRKVKFMDTSGAREARRSFVNSIKSLFGR
jgi:formylmethanofuran dehydrogenase subunit E